MKAQIQSLQEVMIDHSRKCPLLAMGEQAVNTSNEGNVPASPPPAASRRLGSEDAPENVVSLGDSPAEEGKVQHSERGGASKK
mmetsp:Transcript_10300/g.15741  ORF Transcript_10300/g.15741 Transcript_10300/m.15741 type:complete len:83 (+) Transcript_10300:3098-3346(+)